MASFYVNTKKTWSRAFTKNRYAIYKYKYVIQLALPATLLSRKQQLSEWTARGSENVQWSLSYDHVWTGSVGRVSGLRWARMSQGYWYDELTSYLLRLYYLFQNVLLICYSYWMDECRLPKTVQQWTVKGW